MMHVETATESFSSYHVFDGGPEFWPVLPRARAIPGSMVKIALEELPIEHFVSEIPSFELTNRDLTKWVSDSALIELLKLNGRTLEIVVSQRDSLTRPKRFQLTTTVNQYPGRCNQNGGVYLQCNLTDYIGRNLAMRVYHNGVDRPQLQIDRGAGFEAVTMLSHDGSRVSFRYGVHGTTSTFYPDGPPSSAYALEPPETYSGAHLNLVRGMYTKAMVSRIRILGRIERAMLQDGSSYDRGRIGSEIAHVFAIRFLGLKELVIEEPSKGGRDLYTLDQRVAIQARMIRSIPHPDLQEAIQIEFLSLARKLGRDYRYNPGMRTGYAILSFSDTRDQITTIAVQIAHPSEWRLDKRRTT